MKFRVFSAAVKSVPLTDANGVAKRNPGAKYLEMVVAENCLRPKAVHTVCSFVDSKYEAIYVPMWEEACRTPHTIDFDATYEIVNDLRPYIAEDGKVVKTSMKILVELDGEGKPCFDARDRANEIIDSLMTVVDEATAASPRPVVTTTIPITGTVIPPVVVEPASFPPASAPATLTPEQIASLTAAGLM
jgi:hypothetical protein